MKNSKSKKSKKFIAGVVLIVFGACGLTGDLYAIIGGIVLIAVGALLIVLDKRNKKKDFGDMAEPEPVPQDISSHKAKTRTFRVAGVTYNNEDGTSRQSLLMNINNKKEPFEMPPHFTLDIYKFGNEDAISIKADDYVIGNVPREDVSYIINTFDQITDIKVLIYDFISEEGRTIYAGKVTVFYNK